VKTSPSLRCILKYAITDTVRAELATISPATIDRLLAQEKQKPWFLKRHSTTSEAVNHYKTKIPIRTYYGSDEQRPGYLEIDTVFHSGVTIHDEFCCTLDATDTMTGWVELRALLNRAQRWVKEALVDIKDTLPFRLIAIDSDNGSEFLNRQVHDWCIREQIQFTRSRAYHKNDNPFVEQKNSSLVRAYIGDVRLDTVAQTQTLNRLYNQMWLYYNFFQPVMRLNSKTVLTVVGQPPRIKRGYDQAQTPFDRLCATTAIAESERLRLQTLREQTNPRQLRRNIYDLLDQLFNLPGATPGITEDIFETLNITTLQKGEDFPVTLSFDRIPTLSDIFF